MDDKTTGIVSYITLVGWIVALVARENKNDYTNFHLRQMFGIFLTGIALYAVFFVLILILGVELASILYSIAGIGVFVLWVIGIIGAFNNEKKLVPVLGEHFQKWFTFIN